MKNYYLKKHPQINGFNSVHAEFCPLLQGDETIELGRYNSDYEALKAAKQIMERCQICEFCGEPHIASPERYLGISLDNQVKCKIIPGVIYFITSDEACLNQEAKFFDNYHVIYLQDN